MELIWPSSSSQSQKPYCLTMLEYRKAGLSEQTYREHMLRTTALMTKDLMLKSGIKRWNLVSLSYGTVPPGHMLTVNVAGLQSVRCPRGFDP
jgi:hypothetical protein